MNASQRGPLAHRRADESACSPEPPETQLVTGAKAIDFKLLTLNSVTLRLSDSFAKSGSVVVLDLWATWCPPCRAEASYLVQLHKDYSRKGATVVGVAIDARKDRAKVEAFVREHKINNTVPPDPGGENTTAPYKARGIPPTFVIDRKGAIKYTYAHLGFGGRDGAAKIPGSAH